jgi:predicted exporter
MLPFLRAVYYIPIQQAFGYDNIQMGVLTSGLGGLSLLAYFSGAGLLISFNAVAWHLPHKSRVHAGQDQAR